MNEKQKQLNQAKHEAKLAEWRERVRECRNSGMKISKWCKENGINEKTYYRWQQLVWETENKAIQRASKPEFRFVEIPQISIEPENKNGGIIIQKDGWMIELQKNANPELVIQIMQTVAGYV